MSVAAAVTTRPCAVPSGRTCDAGLRPTLKQADRSRCRWTSCSAVDASRLSGKSRDAELGPVSRPKCWHAALRQAPRDDLHWDRARPGDGGPVVRDDLCTRPAVLHGGAVM